MHEVLVNRLGGLSLPRKSVVRLTDRPDMTLDVYRGRKTKIQQNKELLFKMYIYHRLIKYSDLKSTCGKSTSFFKIYTYRLKKNSYSKSTHIIMLKDRSCSESIHIIVL